MKPRSARLIRSVFCILVSLFLSTHGLAAFSLVEARVFRNNEFELSQSLSDKTNMAKELIDILFPKISLELRTILESSQLTIRAFEKDTSNDTDIITLTLNHKEREQTLTLFLKHSDVTSRDISRILVYLAWQLKNEAQTIHQNPLFVSSFSIEPYLANSNFAAFSIPYFTKVLPSGNLVVSALSQLIELSPNLHFVKSFGKELASKGTYIGYEVQASPSGSLLSRAASGGDLYLFNPGIDDARIIRSGISLISSLAYLSDGSILVKDASSERLLRIQAGIKEELKIEGLRTGYSNLKVAAGEDSSFFGFDPSNKFLSHYTRDGKLIDRIIPMLDESSLASISNFSYTAQGYLLLANSFIALIDHHGLLRWRLDFDKLSFGADFLGAQSISFSPQSGAIYLSSPISKLVYKFLDLQYCKEFGINPETEVALANVHAQLLKNPDDEKAIKQLSAYYLKKNSNEQALFYLEKLKSQQSADAQTLSQITLLKAQELKKLSDELLGKVKQTIVQIGPETARPDYSRLMALYEQRLLLEPGNMQIQAERAQVAKLLRDAEAYLIVPELPLRLVNFKLNSVFPALLSSYKTRPIGNVVLRNETGKDVTNVRASLSIQRFMDFASETITLELLKDGVEVQIDLFAILNQEVLSLEEDLPVQAKLVITWQGDGKAMSTDASTITTFYRRTALSWEHSGRLASFITPNEEQVTSFALRAIESLNAQKDSFSTASVFTKIKQANALINALASHGISYLEDPLSPITSILGKAEIIDTVRFARTTLLYKSGDCDDSTALLASLLEAVGIKTAIMTSPGHVFLAFDTGEDLSSKWLFGEDMHLIEQNSTLWIPIESTVLGNGLLDSWKSASSLIKRYPASQIEFIETSSVRDQYPAIPLPQANYTISFPASRLLEQQLTGSQSMLFDHFYSRNVAQIEAKLSSDKRQISSLLNRLAILQARFGFANLAKESFKRILATDRSNLTAMINLANLLLFEGDLGTAMYYVSEAKKIRPNHISLKIVEVQLNYAMGDLKKGNLAWLELKALDAQVAQNYAHLTTNTQSSTNGTRASNIDRLMPVWLYE